MSPQIATYYINIIYYYEVSYYCIAWVGNITKACWVTGCTYTMYDDPEH